MYIEDFTLCMEGRISKKKEHFSSHKNSDFADSISHVCYSVTCALYLLEKHHKYIYKSLLCMYLTLLVFQLLLLSDCEWLDALLYARHKGKHTRRHTTKGV